MRKYHIYSWAQPCETQLIMNSCMLFSFSNQSAKFYHYIVENDNDYMYYSNF